MDFNDTNHQGQYNSSASTFVINNASSMASGYELIINSITPISSYDEYHYLAANDRIVATNMDDIETEIGMEYYTRNKQFMEE